MTGELRWQSSSHPRLYSNYIFKVLHLYTELRGHLPEQGGMDLLYVPAA